MDIQTSSEILRDNLLTFQRCTSEIQSSLHHIEETIQLKISQAKELNHTQLLELINELFNIQEQIAFVLFKFDYPISSFLYHFICDFERCDKDTIQYILKKYLSQNTQQADIKQN